MSDRVTKWEMAGELGDHQWLTNILAQHHLTCAAQVHSPGTRMHAQGPPHLTINPTRKHKQEAAEQQAGNHRDSPNC